jgi:hypothetical protein
MAVDFDFNGIYRVQSRKSGRRGRIAGNWFTFKDRIVSSDALNQALSRNAYWSGVPVSVRAANLTRREGAFYQAPDNLYKIECYQPVDGGERFPCHIVDVLKAAGQWQQRRALVSSLLIEHQSSDLVSLVEDLQSVIANEYCCHEAGHVLGRSVQTKTQQSYFSPGGRVSWPLIWVEEFRADLHSYSVALELMASQDAAALFVYNCFARFGGDALSVRNKSYGYGPIPFLLFVLLLDLGFLAIAKSKSGLKVEVASVSIPEILKTMKGCHLHALREFTEAELATDDPLEWGINAARYYREKVLKNPLREDYLKLLAGEANQSLQISCLRNTSKNRS